MAKAAKRNRSGASYFEEHGQILQEVIKEYKRSIENPGLFGTSEYSVFNSIRQGITKHALRYYQEEALFLLDHIYSHAQAELKIKEQLAHHKIQNFIDDLLDEIEDHKKAPFIGYEMATGSGKTMLMGASIYFLNKKYGINNFLIITPASTDIYQKTIRNFSDGTFDSVWSSDAPFTFNLITGDNYTQNLFFDKSKDTNIFVFNISKFGANATNTEKTWESAVWQDADGNNVSIRQFLKDEKLVIITDEAHHSQTVGANKIIRNFHPLAVLEFTATAVEDGLRNNKRNQNIVYKYDIRRFLEDGHGKLVRAVALASLKGQRRGTFNDNEKLKLITLLLIHLLKKESVLLDPQCRSLKPISFIKVKDETAIAERVFSYVKDELADDLDNIKTILDKVKEQDLQITELLQQLFKKTYQGKINKLRDAIKQVVTTTIFYHGKSDKDTEKKFQNIRKNDVELVVYMQRLDEGIDLPNIFSMAVINDSETDFKTSVKQIIGRGVRLNKEKREFDDEEDELKANSEKLHIVCDQGKNFEEVIAAIQKEFGLNSKYLSVDKKRRPVINRVKTTLLEGKYIPHIKADYKAKEGVSLIKFIQDVDTIASNFRDHNCFEGANDNQKRFLKYRPDSFFIEVDVFADKEIYHQVHKDLPVATLRLTEKEKKTIYAIVQKTLHCLPDTQTVRDAFSAYLARFNEVGLRYYRITEGDDKLAANLFVDAFSAFYRAHIEKHYFTLDFRQLQEGDNWNLNKQFKSFELRLPEDQIEKRAWTKVKDKAKLLELIEGQFHFFGFERSVHDYDKFDSFTEFQLADYANEVLKKVADEKKPFWIRNQRTIYFTYGSKKYYPDFIVFKDDLIYVIETKGELYSDIKKNALLRKLNEVEGIGHVKGYKGLLIYSNQMDRVDIEKMDFEKFVEDCEKTLERARSIESLILEPPVEERYVRYIPAYSADKAHKKFIKHQKTAKPDGWYEVPVKASGEKYPDDVFALQVKGLALVPQYDNHAWIIMKHTDEIAEAVNSIALVYHQRIADTYEGNCTLRRVRLREEKSKKELFARTSILLEPLNDKVPEIILEGIVDPSELVVVGIIYQ